MNASDWVGAVVGLVIFGIWIWTVIMVRRYVEALAAVLIIGGVFGGVPALSWAVYSIARLCGAPA